MFYPNHVYVDTTIIFDLGEDEGILLFIIDVHTKWNFFNCSRRMLYTRCRVVGVFFSALVAE